MQIMQTPFLTLDSKIFIWDRSQLWKRNPAASLGFLLFFYWCQSRSIHFTSLLMGCSQGKTGPDQVHSVTGAYYTLPRREHRFPAWMPPSSTAPNRGSSKPRRGNPQEIHQITTSNGTQGSTASCLREMLRIQPREKPGHGAGLLRIVSSERGSQTAQVDWGRARRKDGEAEKWRTKAVTCGATGPSPAPRDSNKSPGRRPPE